MTAAVTTTAHAWRNRRIVKRGFFRVYVASMNDPQNCGGSESSADSAVSQGSGIDRIADVMGR
jgi:hypothetical protein